jgi:hypothetical protein
MSFSRSPLVSLKASPETIGTLLDVKTIVIKDEVVARCVVCWDDEEMRTPAVNFYAPEDLTFVGFDDEEGEDEDYEGAETEEGEGETEGAGTLVDNDELL